MKSEEKVVVGVRLLAEMKRQLAAKANNSGRSLSGEIVYRLRKSIEQEGSLPSNV
jgi:hypothetical protein